MCVVLRHPICNAVKLIRDLVMTCFPHRSSTRECASELPATPNLSCGTSEHWRWRPALPPTRSPKTHNPRRFWWLFALPISGQNPTHLSNLDSRMNFPVKFVLKLSERIKTVSSVISEEISIIIFRRFGCNFLFTCLNGRGGQVKRQDRLQRQRKTPLPL